MRSRTHRQEEKEAALRSLLAGRGERVHGRVVAPAAEEPGGGHTRRLADGAATLLDRRRGRSQRTR